MSAYTFKVDDSSQLLAASVKQDIERCALFAVANIRRYVEWQGTVDFVVKVLPHHDLTWSTANGLLPAFAQISWNGRSWNNQTLEEIKTGIDQNPEHPDAGCYIYLGADGAIRNYGVPVWFDPNPSFDTNPNLPTGFHDFIGIFTHEVFHCFGFYGSTSQWKNLVTKIGDDYFFNGPETINLIGSPLILADPYSEENFPDHYGNTKSSSNNINRGLMFQWGNYETNRLDIGRIDLAVLHDLGVKIRTYDNLALTELDDKQPNVYGTTSAESIFGDFRNNILVGTNGEDAFEGGSGNDSIDGGAGNDTAKYIGDFNQYGFTEKEGGYVIADSISNRDGVDTLSNIEFVKFSDKTVPVSDLISQAGSGELSVSGTAINSIGKNESVVGSSRIDEFIYTAAASTYQVNYFSGRVTVKNATSGEEDSLTSIERLKFTDKSLAFDITGNAGKAYRIYKAAFARDPQSGDMSGLGFWMSRIDNGMDMVEVAARFIDSNEFRSLFGQNPTNAEFLTKVYTNVLGRTPDQGGYDWWLNELNTNPSKTRAKVLADFAESSENQAGVASLIGNGITYEPWVE